MYVICNKRHHLRCITLNPEHQAYIVLHIFEWICELCNASIFPFNHIERDNDFIHALNFIDNIVILNDASLVFNQIELNDLDHVSPLDEIDPDVNFYN